MSTQVIFSRLRGRIAIAPRVVGTRKLDGVQTDADKYRADADLPTALALAALLQLRLAANAWLRHRATLRAIAMAAAFAGMLATPAVVAVAAPGTGQIGFYSDVVDSLRNTFTQTTATPDVRPSTVMLAEREAVVLEDLRWSGWGTSVARATGFRSVWVCATSCADGKYVKQPARVTLTLSKPGVILGRMVYRCYQIDPPDKRDDPVDHGCLRPMGGGGLYDYE